VPSEQVMERAMAKPLQARLPRIGFGRVKRQLRAATLTIIDSAIAGNEPLLDGWLSEETIAAATSVLQRGK
jgi:hypothetical protein